MTTATAIPALASVASFEDEDVVGVAVAAPVADAADVL
jgi:hypothetical protein